MASPTPGNSNTSVVNILKKWYKDSGLTYATYRKRPLWGLINKKTDTKSSVGGTTFQFAIKTNDNQARNTVFSGAQSQAWGLTGLGTNALTNSVAGPPNVGAIGVVQFSVQRAYNYAYASITTELELSSENQKGAFNEAMDELMSSSLNLLGNDQEISLFGGSVGGTMSNPQVATGGTGFISTIGAATNVASSAGALYLANVFDAQRFSYGQELDLYYNNGGTITRRTDIAGAGLFVGSVDRNQGILYIVNSSGYASEITATFSNAAVGDAICVVNDFNQGAQTGASGTGKIASLESWIPLGGPVGDSAGNPFMGYNRNIGDVTRNAGNWLDATGAISTGVNGATVLNIEDALITGNMLVAQNSDEEVDTWFMNRNQSLKLAKSNIGRVNLPGGAIQTQIPGLSFKAFEVETESGTATVIPDRFCSSNRMHGLYMPSWNFIHLGSEPVTTYMQDGLKSLREPMMDGRGVRFYSFGNTVCDLPSANVTVQIAA